ncbi:MAG: F0F1 ATP synthase subunit B [Bacillaceae bacterium]|nr:F0F1 ATP synthase subunit B [Bacillaceae bacterium]
MLFQVITFIILLLIVRKFAMGPAMSVLEKRQKHIEEQITTAEKNREEAQKLLEEQRAALKEARDEAHEIVERAKKQSEVEAKEILNSAKERADRMVEEARAEIEREKDKAVAELRDQVTSLSVLLASKIIEKELDEKQQQEVIDQFMKQVGDRL